ncbi:MAG: phospholipid carrier-dependent glycosyltransferase [bacterium]|nr:phospholipid carrier-dependent glycosyltransferase [bacterium]
MIELFWLLTIICGAFTLGRRVVRCFKIQPGYLLEEFVLNVGIGLGTLSLIMLGLGFSKLFYPAVAYTLIILLNILFVYELRNFLPRIKFINLKGLDKVTIFLLIIFSLCTFLNFLKAYIPPVTSDVLTYHLTLPRYFIEFHKIYDVSKMFALSELPFLLEMLFTLGMLVGNDLVAQLIHSFYGLLGALTIGLITRKFTTLKISILSAIIFISLPSIISYSGTAMVDIGLAFYMILTVYTFLGWLESSKKGWLIISAVTCGLSISTKYWGGITLILLPLSIIFVKITKREIRLNFTSIFKYSLIFGLLFLLVFSPWMIKSYLHTNNPVSPFVLPGIKSSNWNSFINKGWNSSFKISQMEFMSRVQTIMNFKRCYQKDPARVIHSLLYFNMQFFPLFFLVLFLLPCFKKNPPGINFILIFTLIHFLIGSKPAFLDDRHFFVPLSPTLCVLSAYTLGKIFQKSKLHKQIAVIVLIGLICSWWAYAYAFLTAKGWSHRALPVIFGVESRDIFLRGNLDFYSMADYINTHLSISDKVLSINENRTYYFKTQFVQSDFSLEGTIVHTSSNINEILSSLKKNNIHYIFISRNEYFTQNRQPTILWDEEILNKYFDLLHTNGVCYLYKIKPDAKH